METDDGQAISFPLVQIELLMDCTHVLPFHYFGNKYASNRADKSMTFFGLVTDSVGIFTIYDLFTARRYRKKCIQTFLIFNVIDNLVRPSMIELQTLLLLSTNAK